jgi:hypothetical protein
MDNHVRDSIVNERVTQVKDSFKEIVMSRTEQLLLLRNFQASDLASLLLVSIVREHPVDVHAGMAA